MKVLAASLVAALCGLAGRWLLGLRAKAQGWAGLETDDDIKAGGTD